MRNLAAVGNLIGVSIPALRHRVCVCVALAHTGKRAFSADPFLLWEGRGTRSKEEREERFWQGGRAEGWGYEKIA
jgi:hypothetical protein